MSQVGRACGGGEGLQRIGPLTHLIGLKMKMPQFFIPIVDYPTYCLMEAIIGSVPVDLGLVGILHVVLDVAHFMEDGGKILKVVVPSAHPDAEIFPIVEVPCSCMTNDL